MAKTYTKVVSQFILFPSFYNAYISFFLQAGLRDVVVDASKAARELSSTLGTNEENGLLNKIEVIWQIYFIFIG